MLYIISLRLIYFVTGSMFLLIPFTYLAHPPTPLLSGDHQFILCNYDFVLGILELVCLFRF